jgi:hypothetical protein
MNKIYILTILILCFGCNQQDMIDLKIIEDQPKCNYTEIFDNSYGHGFLTDFNTRIFVPQNCFSETNKSNDSIEIDVIDYNLSKFNFRFNHALIIKFLINGKSLKINNKSAISIQFSQHDSGQIALYRQDNNQLIPDIDKTIIDSLEIESLFRKYMKHADNSIDSVMDSKTIIQNGLPFGFVDKVFYTNKLGWILIKNK